MDQEEAVSEGEFEQEKHEKPEEKPKKRKILKRIIFLILILIAFVFIFQPVQTKGNFATTAFDESQILLTENISFLFSEPEVGDIVVYKNPDNNLNMLGVVIDSLLGDPKSYQVISGKHTPAQVIQKNNINRKILFKSVTDAEIERLIEIQKNYEKSAEEIQERMDSKQELLAPAKNVNDLEGVDGRCEFSTLKHTGPYTVLNYEGQDIITPVKYEYQITRFGRYYSAVKYLRNKSTAVTYGGLQDYFWILDFDSCTAEIVPKEFEYNETLFSMGFRDISPDEKLILYEISYGYYIPPFPGTEDDYSEAAKQKNGYWIYSLDEKKNFQVKQLPVKTDTKDAEFEWEQGQLVIKVTGCPDSGCSFNLSDY